MFHPIYNGSFYKFALQTTHTGSREDYEVYAKETRKSYTPKLRDIYPVILHEEIKMRDWFCANMKMNVLFVPEEPKGEVNITEWYRRKREQIYRLSIANRFAKRMDEFMI